MRAAFVDTLTEMAVEDDRIVLLTGDLGFMALEPFRDRHPERFFNVGVAEENLIGISTGLADAGFTPYCYSIATFATLRGFEFFRNGAVWHDLPVRIVGMGGGFEYGAAGVTHHALEDIGVMRLLPRVEVYAPADAGQTRSVVKHVQTRPGPVYLRLGKDERRRVAGLDDAFEPDAIAMARRGPDGLVLATGSIASEAAVAVEALVAQGVDCSFGVVSTLAPPPTAHLRQLLRDQPWVATVEAHVRNGALGSIVADEIATSGLPVPLLRCCVEDPCASEELGGESFLHELHGISAPQLERRILEHAAIEMTDRPDVSIVLPAYKAVDHINRVVPEMMDAVSTLGHTIEVVLVVNGPDDGTDAAAYALRAKDPRVQVLRADQPGWGRAVGMGLSAASGSLLAYTNLARTPPEVLRTAVALAAAVPGSVVKANRRVRDSFLRRAGSVLYNLECRLLFELSVFDVNGTPKVFPAEYTPLRELRRVDDMIDAEFVATCNAFDYQMVEFAVGPLPRHSGSSTTNYQSAWNMYSQAFVLRRDMQRRLPAFVQERPQSP